MREIAEMKWTEIAPIFREMYDKSPTATPYQSYEFLTFTKKGKPYRKDLFRLIGVKEWNLVLYRDGAPVVIAPLLLKKKKYKHIVYLRGQFTAANQLDFIYERLSYEDFQFLMDHIRNTLGETEFFLDRISEKTVTCGYIKRYLEAGKIEEHECFSIPIAESYDVWLKSLHRSVRRNLVTHYNRLERDNIKWSVSFLCRQAIDKELSRKLMWVYADRFLVKNHFRFGPLNTLVTKILQLFLLRDKITIWLNRPENNFHVVVYMNDEVAAFSSGLFCKDNRVIMARLAILTKYAHYSPGGILISSAIRHITGQNGSGGLNIAELDFSQGGQGGMAYKQTYGGQIHYHYVYHG